jgi:inosine/xanthosine triphosphatase
MIVAIGTKNPAKVHAVQDSLIREGHTFISVKAKSGVSGQPFSDNETLEGARNRAKHALAMTGADLAFGLEGGVQETESGLLLCNWGVLSHKEGAEWIASGAKFPLPEQVANRLRQGDELGTVMADVTGDIHTRKKEGAIGIYTGGWVSRKELFAHIVRLLYGQYVTSLVQARH